MSEGRPRGQGAVGRAHEAEKVTCALRTASRVQHKHGTCPEHLLCSDSRPGLGCSRTANRGGSHVTCVWWWKLPWGQK